MAPSGPKALLSDIGKQRGTPIVGATHINNKLVVSNLHYEITPKDLTVSFFYPSGNLKDHTNSFLRPYLVR